MTTGVPHWDKTAQAYVGGMFWDGRATDTRSQVTVPLYNPVEMNNTVKGKPSPELVAKKLHSGIVSWRFKQVFGQDVFTKPPKVVVDLAAQAIVAYEKSDEVSPFTSKYDAYLEGKATLSPEELVGMRFVTGTINGRPGGIPFRRSAHCTDCHMLSTNLMDAPDLWTASCYANLGVPRNSFDLNYLEAKAKTHGKAKFKPDFGLGDFLYPHMGLPAGDLAQGDPLHIDGLFKAPTLRNVDKRPYPGFVKCYMHNGVFKSLKQVVHFYFTRNATSYPREVIDFRKKNPYANLRGHPFWAPPEYPDPNTLVNPTGASSSSKARIPSTGTGDLDSEQIGDLRLGPAQEDAIVAFLKALSDGYYVRDAKPTVRQAPHPVAPRSN
jgi:cytochrome c peroxidase